MSFFLNLLLISLLTGVLGGIPLGTGVFIYLHDIVICCAVAYHIILLKNKKKLTVPRLWKPILMFLFAGVISLIVNSANFSFPSLLIASLYLVRWLLYTSLYILLVQSHIPARTIMYRLFLFGCAFAILGILQFLLYPNLRFLLYLGWDPHYYRLFSTLLDPNFAGIILIFTILLGYYLYIKESKPSYIIWITIIGCCVYLTYSRSSYLALMVGVLVYGILQKQWKTILVIFLFVLCILFIPRPGGNTLRLLREDSTYSRFSNWKESVVLFARSPLFGHGFNTLRFIQTPKEIKQETFVSHAAAGVDSSVLFLLVTSGMIGLASYIYLLYKASVPNKTHKEIKAIRHLYGSSIAALFVHSLFVNSMFYPWVLVWMWMIIAAQEIIYDT